MSCIKAPVPHLPFNLRWICIGCLYSPDTVLWSLRATAISHEDLLLVINVGPHLPFSNTQAWDTSYVQIFLYVSQRCCILAQRGSFAVKIIFCIFRHAFLFSFVQHTCSSSSSVHKALENVQLEKSHIECMHRFSHTKEQWVPLAVTTFAYRCQISAGPPIMSGRSHLINCLLPLGLNMQRRLGKAERWE